MTNEEVITRISIFRVRANLSARALSIAIEKSDGYIHNLETARNFLPSLSTLLKIIEACGSTPEEFFYSDIHQYKTDKKALDFLKTLSETQKEAIMNLYKK
jgi:transcriptional regulator with XRE-family HTH domain